MNKKQIITITIVGILIIILGIIFINIPKDNKNNTKDKIDINEKKEKIKKTKEDTTNEENNKKEEENKNDNTNVETKQKTESKETKSNNSKQTNQTQESKQQVNTQTQEPQTPVITYSCPDGYTLNGTTCSITVSAQWVCPDGTTDYSNDGIPRDTYCVNLSEGYESDGSCPSGYGSAKMITFGSGDKYMCFPLHSKYYTCDSGFNLSGNTCTRTIEATQN